MRLGIAQLGSLAGDFAATADRMSAYSRRAADQGVDLLVFPMNVLSGAAGVPYVDREGFLLDLAETLSGLTERLACPCLVPATADVDGTPTPEAMLVVDGDVRPLRLSAFIEDAVAADSAVPDRRHAASSRTLPEMELAGARLGIACSYDDLDDYDEYDYDVNVILYLSTYGFSMDDASSALGPALADSRFLADARATGAWICGVGSLGCYDAETFTGSSFVLAPWGEVAAQAPALEEALLVCDVDPASEGPLPHALTPEVFDRGAAAWGALTLGLGQTCSQLGASDVALLADGRLGSSVLAALATDALGPTHVHALIAPDLGPVALAAARDLCRNLRVDARECPSAPGEGDPLLRADVAQAHLAALAREVGGVALSDVLAFAHMRNTVSPVIPAAARMAYDVPDLPGLAACGHSCETRLEFADYVLASYVEWELPVSDIVEARGHEQAVCAILARVRALSWARRAAPPALMMSSKLLDEVRSPLGLAWSDRVRPHEERLAATLAAFDREGRDEKRQAPAAQAACAGQGGLPQDAHELLGLLRDVSLGGGLSLGGGEPGPQAGASGQDASGRHGFGSSRPGGGLWNGPFSEN